MEFFRHFWGCRCWRMATRLCFWKKSLCMCPWTCQMARWLVWPGAKRTSNRPYKDIGTKHAWTCNILGNVYIGVASGSASGSAMMWTSSVLEGTLHMQLSCCLHVRHLALGRLQYWQSPARNRCYTWAASFQEEGQQDDQQSTAHHCGSPQPQSLSCLGATSGFANKAVTWAFTPSRACTSVTCDFLSMAWPTQA